MVCLHIRPTQNHWCILQHFKNHIGFYATPSGHEEFAGELSKYTQGKGSVQFTPDKPIPFQLIERIVEFRVKENTAKSK